MQIIKEYCPDNDTVVIRTDSYSKTYEHISKLVIQARNDFNVKDDAIQIMYYRGNRYRHTLGIEFSANKQNIPNNYTRIAYLEFSL